MSAVGDTASGLEIVSRSAVFVSASFRAPQVGL